MNENRSFSGRADANIPVELRPVVLHRGVPFRHRARVDFECDHSLLVHRVELHPHHVIRNYLEINRRIKTRTYPVDRIVVFRHPTTL